MTYHSRTKGRGSALVIAIIVVVAILHYQGWSTDMIAKTILVGLVALLSVALLYRPIVGILRVALRSLNKWKNKRAARSLMAVDDMNWSGFEYFVADWLRDKGFTDVRLTEHYDLGVDIVAKKDGLCWGVQVKHYHGLVGINAVRQVVVALKKYKCDRAMVVTNSTFSRPAIELADSQDCLLIDGSKLA